MTPHPTNHRVTCPDCDSKNVAQQECGAWAWLVCLDCRYKWNDETTERVQRIESKKYRGEQMTE